MAAPRDHFASRLGFVLAAAGSAIGLGNIWKFPYVAGENGGGAFVVLYLLLVFTIGVSVMLAEFALGRATERNPVGAFASYKRRLWPAAGYLCVIAGFVILSFYSVVGGWTIAYVVKIAGGLLTDGNAERLGDAFGGFVSSTMEPLVYHGIFMLLTIGVIYAGVGHGIERAARILMPAFFLLLVILIGRSLSLPGAWDGVAFLLTPDFSKVTPGTFNAALSQAFFSLSLGMGAMITYGSYLSHKENIATSAGWVTTLDSLVALFSGLLVFPAVFAFGFDPQAGPGLTFITLPAVFAQMPAGTLFGIAFFVLLIIAALTSAVSLLEVVVAYAVDERGIGRHKATFGIGAAIFLLGIPSSLSLGAWSGFTIFGKGIFDLLDFLTTNLFLPLGGLLIVSFVGWVVYPQMIDEILKGGEHRFGLAPVWKVMCRYVAPVAIVWILISGLL